MERPPSSPALPCVYTSYFASVAAAGSEAAVIRDTTDMRTAETLVTGTMGMKPSTVDERMRGPSERDPWCRAYTSAVTSPAMATGKRRLYYDAMPQSPTNRPQESLDAWLREVVDWHFDPVTGTPFWLEFAAKAGWDPRRDVRTF